MSNRAEPWWKYRVYVTMFGAGDKPEVIDWLVDHVGDRSVDWHYEASLLDGKYIEETVEFANRNHKLMFELCWGHICHK